VFSSFTEHCVQFAVKECAVQRIGIPRNQRSRDTRAQLLDAAWELLEERGGAALTMAGVAEAAAVSRSGLYLHFTSRGQLFAALLDHIDERLDVAGSLRAIEEAVDAETVLAAWARHVACYHYQLIAVVRAVDRCRHDDPDAAALWQTATAGWYARCRSVTERLREQGRLAAPWTPTTAADLLWVHMSVHLVDNLRNERGWSTDEFTQRLSLVASRALLR
jgi:AcrR family transcriptional regulator